MKPWGGVMPLWSAPFKQFWEKQSVRLCASEFGSDKTKSDFTTHIPLSSPPNSWLHRGALIIRAAVCDRAFQMKLVHIYTDVASTNVMFKVIMNVGGIMGTIHLGFSQRGGGGCCQRDQAPQNTLKATFDPKRLGVMLM